jgi:putative acetyltransferase
MTHHAYETSTFILGPDLQAVRLAAIHEADALPMTMTVRPEEPADRDASLEVAKAAFATTRESDIVVAVRDEAGSFALIAEEGSRVVGHVQMSKAWIGDQEVLALGPIAVMPTRQRKGYGTALVAAALEEAAARNTPAVLLLGSPRYYGGRGFEPAGRYALRNPFTGGTTAGGFEIAEEDFQIAVLDAARVRSMKGIVRWHPALGKGCLQWRATTWISGRFSKPSTHSAARPFGAF